MLSHNWEEHEGIIDETKSLFSRARKNSHCLIEKDSVYFAVNRKTVSRSILPVCQQYRVPVGKISICFQLAGTQKQSRVSTPYGLLKNSREYGTISGKIDLCIETILPLVVKQTLPLKKSDYQHDIRGQI